jgi:hypothetical protein
MNTSDYITALAAWLQSIGVTVELYAHDLPYAGLYRSETREIFMNVPGAESALMTLAHEAGHHVGYVLTGHDRNERRPSLHRERQAYVYGWRVLQLIGADKLISRRRWIADCRASHRAFVEDQRAATDAARTRFRMTDEQTVGSALETR